MSTVVINPNKWEQQGAAINIGSDTRDMLIAYGKFSDAISLVADVLNRNWCEEEAEEKMKPIYDISNEMREELSVLIGDVIIENCNFLNTEGI